MNVPGSEMCLARVLDGGRSAQFSAGLPLHIFAEDDCFGEFFHGLATLAALLLEGEVGLFLGEMEFALQDALGALDDFARLEAFGEQRIFRFEPRQLDFRSHKKPKGRDQPHFAFRVAVRFAVLDVDDADDFASAEHRNREEGLVAVFREFVEKAEARIVECTHRNDDRFDVFSDPSGDALAEAQFEVVDGLRMRIHGGAEDELVALEGVNEAGIAADDEGNEDDHLLENFVQRIGSRDAFRDLMNEIDVRRLKRGNRKLLLGHGRKLEPHGGGCPI